MRMLSTFTLLSLAFPAWAQLGAEKYQSPLGYVAYDKADKEAALSNLSFRPNVTKPVYFYLKNPNPGPVKDIRFRLFQVYAGGRTEEIAAGTVKQLAKQGSEGDMAPVVFDKMKTPPKDDASWPKLEGTPFKILASIEFPGGSQKQEVPIVIRNPQSYLKISSLRFRKNKLSVEVTAEEPLDPPCPVELVLDSLSIPGLVPSKSGAFLQELDRVNNKVTLTAENLVFEDGVPAAGRVAIHADGYQRVFQFDSPFRGEVDTPNLSSEEYRARMLVTRYTPGQDFLDVALQVDGPSFASGKLDLGFNKSGESEFVVTPLEGLRQQILQYRISDEGNLLVRTKVQDWVVKAKTKGVFGPRKFRLQVKDENGIKTWVDEAPKAGEAIPPLFDGNPLNPHGVLTYGDSGKSLFADVLIDPTPAETIRIANLPKQIEAGSKIVPHVTTAPREGKAPVVSVLLFVGELEGDDKIPAKTKTTPAVWSDSKQAYVATKEILIPSETKDQFVLSAQVTTAAGVVSAKSETVPIYVPVVVVVKKKEKLTAVKVKGVVVHGYLAQKGTKLTLFHAKDPKVEPKEVSSGEGGVYVFEKVAPGPYVLVAEKGPFALVARLPVEVPDDKEQIDVPVKLTAK